jgi:RNA polymerase sigma-70 factor (sigma-E family)
MSAPPDQPPRPTDEASFQAFYQRNWLPMVRLAALLVDDSASAEDVVQDAFIACHSHRGRLRSDDAELAYLRSAVLNGARSTLRRRALFRRHNQPRAESLAEPADSQLMAAPENSPVIAAIRRLPRRQREVLVLRYWQDLPHADVAALLGISESTAKSTASRALDALELILKEQS